MLSEIDRTLIERSARSSRSSRYAKSRKGAVVGHCNEIQPARETLVSRGAAPRDIACLDERLALRAIAPSTRAARDIRLRRVGQRRRLDQDADRRFARRATFFCHREESTRQDRLCSLRGAVQHPEIHDGFVVVKAAEEPAAIAIRA